MGSQTTPGFPTLAEQLADRPPYREPPFESLVALLEGSGVVAAVLDVLPAEAVAVQIADRGLDELLDVVRGNAGDVLLVSRAGATHTRDPRRPSGGARGRLGMHHRVVRRRLATGRRRRATTRDRPSAGRSRPRPAGRSPAGLGRGGLDRALRRGVAGRDGRRPDRLRAPRVARAARVRAPQLRRRRAAGHAAVIRADPRTRADARAPPSFSTEAASHIL